VQSTPSGYGTKWNAQPLLAVCLASALLFGADNAQSTPTQIEEARQVHDPYFRALLATHLDGKYHHDFASIDPGWRVEKHWLKPVTNAYEMLDIENHPVLQPEWLVSLNYFDGEQRVKTIRLSQDDRVISEIDIRDSTHVSRTWNEDGELLRYDFRVDGRMMAGISRRTSDGAVSSFQDGRGTWKQYNAHHELASTLHIWDGDVFCAETYDGASVVRVSLSIPGVRIEISGDTEVLTLDTGHERWTRSGETIHFVHDSSYIKAGTRNFVHRALEELSDVPTMPTFGRDSREMEAKRKELQAQWQLIYPDRRSVAIASLHAYFKNIGQETLLNRWIKID